LSYIASGLFDGVRFETGLGNSIIALGAFYTGLLYKKTAAITMTADELESYNAPIDWGDVGGTYFAPRRVLYALGYDNVAAIRLRLALLGQGDFREEKAYYHSQYAAVRITAPYKSLFTIDAGGTAELIEVPDKVMTGFAANLTFAFMPLGGPQDRIYLGGRWSSGAGGEDSPFGAFTPITTKNQGRILKAKFSGLAAVEAGYTARLHRSFSLQVDGLYFFRTDQETYTAWPMEHSASYLLGGEVYTQFIWSPVSDVQFNLGAGVFIPMPETAEKPRWQLSLNVVLVIL
jgi:hypothetical protein